MTFDLGLSVAVMLWPVVNTRGLHLLFTDCTVVSAHATY